MSNELIHDDKMIAIWNDSKMLSEIKGIFASNLSDSEFKTYVQMGMATGLNPFLREIWAVKYDKNSPAQIFIGRDGYRKALSKIPEYDGHVVDAVYSNDVFKKTIDGVQHEYNMKDRGRLVGAYCLVYMKNTRIPYYKFAELAEYDKNHGIWKTMKSTMIQKVAECQSIRMAGGSVFSGTYSPDEMVYQNKAVNTAKYEPTVIDYSIQVQEGEISYEFNEIMKKMEIACSIKDLQDSVQMITASGNKISEEERNSLRSFYRIRLDEISSKDSGDLMADKLGG